MGYRRATPVKIPSDQTKLAYMAGLIDGEGTIGIFVTRSRAGVRCHSVRVVIANTDEAMVRWVDKTFGGTINLQSDHREDRGWKPCLVWITTGQKAEMILEAIMPYLITKKKQAKLALALGRTRLPPGKKLTPSIIGRRDKMKNKMHELNRRGL